MTGGISVEFLYLFLALGLLETIWSWSQWNTHRGAGKRSYGHTILLILTLLFLIIICLALVLVPSIPDQVLEIVMVVEVVLFIALLFTGNGKKEKRKGEEIHGAGDDRPMIDERTRNHAMVWGLLMTLLMIAFFISIL